MRVIPISRMYQTQKDLRKKSDAQKMTMERAIEHCKAIDPSFVVDLNKKDIPSFLYNSSGKLT